MAKGTQQDSGIAGGALPGFLNVPSFLIILCYELGGQAAAVGGLPWAERIPRLHSHLSSASRQRADCCHEFTQKHQAGNSLSMHMRSQPCPCPLGLIFHRGVVCGHLSGQAAHAMGLNPHSFPTFIIFRLRACNQRCELEVENVTWQEASL